MEEKETQMAPDGASLNETPEHRAHDLFHTSRMGGYISEEFLAEQFRAAERRGRRDAFEEVRQMIGDYDGRDAYTALDMISEYATGHILSIEGNAPEGRPQGIQPPSRGTP